MFDKLIEKIKSPQKHWEFLLKQNDNSDDLLKISNYLASEIRKRRYL